MLKISEQTFDAFSAQKTDVFVKGIADSLSQNMASQAGTFSRQDLESLVRWTLNRAKIWNIEDDDELGKLCAMVLGFGEGVLDDPSVAAYLASPEIESWRRVSALLAELE